MRKFAIALAAASLAALPLSAQDTAPTEEEQPQAVETETPADTAPEATPAEEAMADHGGNAAEAEHGAAVGEEPADAAHATGHTEDFDFSFEGPFGKYDQNQLQRGLKIYTEICSGCHGLRYVSFRSMAEDGGLGYSNDQVRAYANAFSVLDEDNNRQFYDPAAGEFRAPLPSDNFPANMTAGAPDLSLMAKARAGFHGPYGTGINQFFKGMGGPEYIASVLSGYTGREKEEYGSVFYENTAFPGGWIAMAPPLSGEDVEFDDGHDNSLHHEAMDVAAFLMWAAEPKMMQRKETGFLIVGFMIVLSVLLYLTNKRLWAPHKARAKALNAKA